ncbi:MAG: rane-flanked domain protein [Rickettsiaceae bacterium]|jgi:uncharacterized membrane protein YdbT with pleckstrin-like domain|nr:rane-flanked domain protein [Rickettsiaceae bacterium]
MSYVDNNLLSNEIVIQKANIHWFVYAKGVLLLTIALYLGFSSPGAGTVGLIVGLVIFGLISIGNAFVETISTELAITNKRIIAKHGLVSRKTVELNLPKVESLKVDQSVSGRMFDFGTVVIHGTGGVSAPFKYIDSPLSFRKTVNEQIESLNDNKVENKIAA